MSTPGGSTINTSGLGGLSGTDWSQLIGAILSGYGAVTGSANTNAQTIANAADPQQALRQGGINTMTQFESNPEAYLNDPIIQASIKQGEEGVARQFGALGAGNSGGALAAIQQQGQQTAFGDLNTRFNQIMQLVNSGNPLARAGALAQGQANQASNVAGGLAGIAPLLSLISQLTGGSGGLGNLFGGSGSSGGYTISNDPNAVPVGAATPGTDPTSIVPGSPDFLPTTPDMSQWTSGFDTSGFDLSGLFGGGLGP